MMRRAARALLGAAPTLARSSGGAASAAAEAAGTPPWWCRRAARRSMWTDPRGYEHFSGRGPVIARGRLHWWAGGALAAGGAYYNSCLEEVPYTHRRHAIMFVSNKSETALGQQIFEQTLREAKAEGRLLPPGHPLSQLVMRVGRRIAQVACAGEGGGYQEHMQHINWEFAVINSPQVNAFVAPGGKVVVFTGLLNLIRSEDELAAVLAHEAAHVVARHVAERLSQANVMGLASVIFNWFLGIPLSPNLLVLTFFLPHSRAAESEADAIGLQLLARACYDPDANVRMLARLAGHEKQMGGAESGKLGQLLQTHPLSEDRAAAVRAALPGAYAVYRRHCSLLRDAWGEAAAALG